jgi:hypothetical protein
VTPRCSTSHCVRPPRLGMKTCGTCSARASVRNQLARREAAAAGCCGACGATLTGEVVRGKVARTCADCRRISAIKIAARRAARATAA